nr:interleukin enhancer binding factor 2 [Hymenolepis microstoma]
MCLKRSPDYPKDIPDSLPAYSAKFKTMKESKHQSSYNRFAIRSLPLSYTTFDPVYCSSIFPGVSALPENEELSVYLMKTLSRITPSTSETLSVGTLACRVMESLESLALAKSTSMFGIQGTSLVGSFKKGTMLAGHKIADAVVLLRDLPTIKLTRQIGHVLTEKLGGCEIIYQPYGFDVEQGDICVRVVFAVENFDGISNAQEGVHISQPDQKLAHVAVLHGRWAEQNASHPNIKALIRSLKDLRRRFVGFSNLNPWQIDMIASYVIMDGPITAPLSLSAGFRRFIQILSTGFFAPSSSGLLDPFRSRQSRVHVTMSLAQQDELCRAAQTVCKILKLSKYQVLFDNMCPTKLITLEELVNSANALPGEKISVPNPIDLELSSVKIIDENRLSD